MQIFVDQLVEHPHAVTKLRLLRHQRRRWERLIQVIKDQRGFDDRAAVVHQRRHDTVRVELQIGRIELVPAQGEEMFLGVDGTSFILRLAENVHDASQRRGAHGNGNSLAGVLHGEPAAQTFGSAHGDGAHDAVAQLLLHFEGQVHIVELERVIDLGDLIARKFHIDDRADDLHDFAAAHFD